MSPSPPDARAANARLNHEEAARKATTLRSRPRMLFLELTRACNLTCPMCRPTLLSGSSLAMGEEVLDRVADELFPFVEVVDLRGFGESTLDNRLVPLVDRLTADGVATKILTNLSIRTERYWRELGERPLRVGISIEAARPATYEESRRGASHARLLRNLAALRSGQMGRGGRDDCYLNVVVVDEYLEELVDLVELAGRHQIPMVLLNPLGHEGDDGGPATGIRPESVDALREQLERARARGDELGVELRLGANLAEGCTDLGGYDQCLHPWSYVFVQHDGGVGFCDHLIANDASMFGNLTEEPFMGIWNGPRYRALRDDHAHHRFDGLTAAGIECSWCYESRYVDHEDMIEPDLTPMTLTGPALIRALLPEGRRPPSITGQPVTLRPRPDRP